MTDEVGRVLAGAYFLGLLVPSEFLNYVVLWKNNIFHENEF